MTSTKIDLLASLRTLAFELDELDGLRSRILRKRALLLAAAFDQPELNRMEIAMAAGVALNRGYALAAQGRGMTPPLVALAESEPSKFHLIESDEAVQLWGEDVRGTEWLAFQYLAPDRGE